MRRAGVWMVLAFAAASAAGCSQRDVSTTAGPTTSPVTKPATPATTQSTAPKPSQGGTFDRPKLGVRLNWPPGWTEQTSKDFVLLLSRGGADDAGGDQASISLDVPDLPPHIPGMIPIGSVRGGYLDDLRKSVGRIQTTDAAPPPVPAAASRLVRSTWTDSAGRQQQETALLMVHADRVYILRARSAASDEPGARAAFDEMVRSLKWTK
jgi:hypothetical protein